MTTFQMISRYFCLLVLAIINAVFPLRIGLKHVVLKIYILRHCFRAVFLVIVVGEKSYVW